MEGRGRICCQAVDGQADEAGGDRGLSVTSPPGPRCCPLGTLALRRCAATSVSAADDMMDYLSHCQPSQNQSATDKEHQPPTPNLRLSRVIGRTEESIETEAPSTARLLHAILSHVKLSLVAQWHQQWPKTAAPQKHSHAFHARLPQKCCAEIDTSFDVLLPAVN
ncbi:unnamed protein product [Leuciscus chuanchicus]